MITELKKILLNSIRTKQPKEKIIRLAKTLYKLAYNYQEVMISRFIEMLGNIPERTLIKLITTDDSTEVLYANDIVNPEKREKLKRLLSGYTTLEIGQIADKIIEASPSLKNKFAAQFKSGIENIQINTPNNSKYTFEYTPTLHFGHRRYLRDIYETELKKVLIEYSMALLSNFEEATKYKRGSKIAFTSKVQKDNKNITIVTTMPVKNPSTKKYEMSLVTIFQSGYTANTEDTFEGYTSGKIISQEKRRMPLPSGGVELKPPPPKTVYKPSIK
jgi:hypothetical protein